MKYSSTRYTTTAHADYMELHCYDGTVRGVMFVDEHSAKAAMEPGRPEMDCAAIAEGFLPRGAILVSSAGVDEDAYEGDLNAIQQARVKTMEAGYVTPDSDAIARRRSPNAARRYDAATEPVRTPGDTLQ